MSAFSMGRDINGYNSFSLSPAPLIQSVIFDANTAASFTVPESASSWTVVFSIAPGESVWVDYTTTAAIPSSNAFDEGTSELNPASRSLQGGTVVSAICDSPNVTMSVLLYPNTNSLGGF